MKLTLKYFGLIAEVLNKTEEIITLERTFTVGELLTQLVEKNSALKNIDFKIAVNQELANNDFIIVVDSEIALLPPFAGG